MYDYMHGLKAKFFKAPELNGLKQEIHQLHRELSAQMDRDTRRKLLRLVDTSDTLRNEEVFAGFVAGFRLADGIAKELSQEKAYSFDDDTEELARKAVMEKCEQAHDNEK